MSRKSRAHNIADDTSDGRKRRFKKPVRAYLIYTLVVLLLATGVTAARYMVSSEAADKARVITFGDIDVVEDKANGPLTKDGKLAILPGADITKKATVEFEGSESACYVFIKVTAPSWQHTDDTHMNFGAMSYTNSDGTTDYKIKWGVSADWKYVTDGEDSGKNYYVYYKILDANQTMGKASGGKNVIDGTILENNTISVAKTIKSTELKNVGGFEITLEAMAMQYDGVGDAKAAWKTLSGN